MKTANKTALRFVGTAIPLALALTDGQVMDEEAWDSASRKNPLEALYMRASWERQAGAS